MVRVPFDRPPSAADVAHRQRLYEAWPFPLAPLSYDASGAPDGFEVPDTFFPARRDQVYEAVLWLIELRPLAHGNAHTVTDASTASTGTATTGVGTATIYTDGHDVLFVNPRAPISDTDNDVVRLIAGAPAGLFDANDQVHRVLERADRRFVRASPRIAACLRITCLHLQRPVPIYSGGVVEMPFGAPVAPLQLADAASALLELHSAGLVHGDVHRAAFRNHNEDEDMDDVVVLDCLEWVGTDRGHGRHLHAPPERTHDFASDIFALGRVFSRIPPAALEPYHEKCTQLYALERQVPYTEYLPPDFGGEKRREIGESIREMVALAQHVNPQLRPSLQALLMSHAASLETRD